MQQAKGGPDEQLAAAHKALRAQGDIQMDMEKAPGPPEPPKWLTDFMDWLDKALAPVGRFFKWINDQLPDVPFIQIFFWTVIAILAALFLWMAIDRFRHGEWRLPRLRRNRPILIDEDEAEQDWRPDAAPVRAWLQEADALAAAGRFAEAAHHLLLRSIDDLAKRRPQLVRPALTSRDLSASGAIPLRARALFAQIAAVVEQSLFGGRPVDAEDWADCRAAYANFAEAGSWRA